jgi:hypothetical protein
MSDRDHHDQAVSDFAVAHPSTANHSFSFDHRRRPGVARQWRRLLLADRATSGRFPSVTPV